MKQSFIFIISLSFLFACSTSDNQKLYEEKMNELQLKLSGLCNYNSLIDIFKEGGNIGWQRFGKFKK